MHQGCIRWRRTRREAGTKWWWTWPSSRRAGRPITPARLPRTARSTCLATGSRRGRWYGAGAASLGQSGEASTEAFRRVFEGRHPDIGELLGRPHGRNAVPAFDVVLRPTKSVSILYGLGDQVTGRVVLAAHHAGLAEAVAYLDEHVGTRRGHGGGGACCR